MRIQTALAALFVLFSACVALADPSDRASQRTEETRAKADGRFNRLEQSQPTQETVVKEQVVTVPVKKGALPKGAFGAEAVQPKTKRVVVRKLETVQKPPPLKISPY